MQSCSVHHCVLFLLTLTLTTDPGSAFSFPIYAKLNESVTLPCGAPCSGRAQWALDSDRDVVFARCDQTSCTSLKEGYEMSYDQFKKGDLSLTITNPDYSMRKTYTCECDYSEFATARLRISTVFSAVQMSPGEDLKLDVSVPEPVKVIYRGSDSADDVQICNVTQRSLQCKSEYTPRTSLSYPELTLRHMERSESGTYTIRNLDYKEDIRVYAVSVSGLTHGETVGIVIPVLILALLIAGVVYLKWIKPEQKRRLVISDKEPVLKLTIQAQNNPAGEMEEVEEKNINPLQKKYRGDSQYSGDVVLFCEQMRLVLSLWKNLSRTQMKSLHPRTEEVIRDMIAVDDLIKEGPLRRAGEVWVRQEEVKMKELKQKYKHKSEYEQHVFRFCYIKRSEMDLCEKLYGSRNAVKEEVKRRMVAVNDLMKQVKRSTTGEDVVKAMKKALQETNKLELDYMWNRKYSHHVTKFCTIQRIELDWYINFYTAQIEKQDNESSEYANVSELGEKPQSLVVAMERAMKIFEKLKDEATSKRHDISSEQLNEMFTHVDKDLWCINVWCRENSTYLENIKDPEIKALMESHVHRVQQWYEQKIMELSRYKEVLPAQAPKAPRNTDGEERIPLV